MIRCPRCVQDFEISPEGWNSKWWAKELERLRAEKETYRKIGMESKKEIWDLKLEHEGDGFLEDWNGDSIDVEIDAEAKRILDEKEKNR